MRETSADRFGTPVGGFGAELRRLREAADLSQEALAERAGLSAEAISALERGKRRAPHPNTAQRLVDVLGLTPDQRSDLLAAARLSRGNLASDATTHVSSAPLPPLPLVVGRAAELAILDAQLDLASAGQGHLVLIEGEAGIGKTTLIRHLARRAAQRGERVLTGHGYDLTETPPYGPWRELFALAADETRGGDPSASVQTPRATSALSSTPFEDGIAGVSSQEELFSQVKRWLRALASERPVVLVLEDLHWVDEASLDLLRFLSRDLATRAILLVATYRSEEVGRDQRLYRLLPLIVREASAVRLSLSRLDGAAVREWVGARYELTHAPDADRLVDHLVNRGGGNPLFIGELLRALEDAAVLRSEGGGWLLGDLSQARLPVPLRQVIERQLARLGEKGRGQLEIAAVLGHEVTLDQWAQVAAVPTEEDLFPVIEQAVATGIVLESPDGTRVSFSHPLVREALYDGLLAARRRGWHRRSGEVLAEVDGSDPETVAYHWRQASDPREADWLVRAGNRARDLYVPRRAIEQYGRAMELLHQQRRSAPLTLYRGRGLAYQAVGEFVAARQDLETALALARAQGERQAEWQGLLDLGFLWEGHDYRQAGGYYHQALDLARTSNEPADLAASLSRLGVWYLNVDLPAEGGKYIQEALARFHERGDRQGTVEALELLGAASLISGDNVQCESYARQAVALARELDDKQTLVMALTLLGASSGVLITNPLVFPLGTAESQTSAEEAVRLAHSLDSPSIESYALPFLGTCLGLQGQYVRALELTRRAVELAQSIGHRERESAGHDFLGMLYADVFAYSLAQKHLERALVLAREMGSPYFIRELTGILAIVCTAQGEFVRAEELIASELGPDDPPNTEARRICWHARAILALARKDPTSALAIADRLIASDPTWNDDRFSPHLVDLRARALTLLGRYGEAETALRAARRFVADRGIRSLLWRIDASLCALYRRQGRTALAQTTAAAARALVDELAAGLEDDLREGFLRGADELLGVSRPLATIDEPRPAGLSTREVEVLRLLAEGLSNAQIAERLILSVRTINTHLTSIYRKLNVISRGAAIRYALDHNLRESSSGV